MTKKMKTSSGCRRLSPAAARLPRTHKRGNATRDTKRANAKHQCCKSDEVAHAGGTPRKGEDPPGRPASPFPPAPLLRTTMKDEFQ